MLPDIQTKSLEPELNIQLAQAFKSIKILIKQRKSFQL